MLSETELLLWAAGGPEPNAPQYDEALLLSAVRAHHLEVRLSLRLAEHRPGWATRSLSEAADDLAATARATTRMQFEALREVLAHASPAARPLLSKGMTYFLLTGREHMLKRCGDLDLFSRDPPRLCEELLALGYAVDGKSPPQPCGRVVFHEFAKLYRGELEIDLHSRFPVWRYPEVPVAATAPAANPGAWECVHGVGRRELSSESLFASEVRRTGFDDTPLPVTGPEMTVLLSCCHVFANYLTEFRRPYGTVRLNELACIAEMVSEPGFDLELFYRLVADRDAADAAAFALALIDRWLGVACAAPAGARRPGDALPPRSLWFARGEGSFLVALDESPEDVLILSTPAAAVVSRLGGVAVEGTGEWHATDPHLPGAPFERTLTHGSYPIRFAVTWTDAGLRFDVRPAVPADGREINLLLFLGDDVVEGVHHAGGELFAYDRVGERRIDAAALPFEPGYSMTLPWDRLPEGDVPVLLGARMWQADGSYPSGGTLVPVVVAAPRS